jgi:hypothetical protein
MSKHTGPRIVTLDIETSPIVAYVWSLWKQNVGLNQIVQDWSILSVSYKWLNEKRAYYYDVSGQADIRDDRAMLEVIWDILDEADIVVAQNGIAFDVKKIMARFIQAGMEPPSPFKVVDTMVEAKNIARFTSNRLAWLSDVLTDTPKSEHKKFPGFELWTECLADNPAAWKEMRKYNIRDVEATEKVYLRLRPYIKGHPNVNSYDDSTELRCGHCGSTQVARRGYQYTQVGKYSRFKCDSCGAWGRGGYTENTLAKRKSLLRTG